MRFIILSLVLTIHLFATMILNLDVKEKRDRVELLLNFDAPYELPLVKSKAQDRIDIILKKVKLLARWQKKLSSTFVYQIDAIPLGEATKISFYTTNNPKLFAARSKDGLSLKLILKSPAAPSSQAATASSFDLQKTIIALAAITLLALLLFLGRKLLTNKKHTTTKKHIVLEPQKRSEFQILFEKPLDEQNKIALISHKGINYLVIIGTSNVLLGKYKEGEIETHEDFERAIEGQDLSEALRPKQEDEIFTTIEEYKRRASGDF